MGFTERDGGTVLGSVHWRAIVDPVGQIIMYVRKEFVPALLDWLNGELLYSMEEEAFIERYRVSEETRELVQRSTSASGKGLIANLEEEE